MKKIICLLVGLMCFVACSGPAVEKQLDDAIDFDDVTLVKQLLNNGANPNLLDGDGDPKLISLMRVHLDEDDEAILKLLLESGADPNVTDKDGNTPLTVASFHGDVPFMQLLLDAGANPNAYDKDGYSALMLAASEGHAEAVKLLLARGADPNLLVEARTALYWAVLENRANTVQLLLDAGADPNAKLGEHINILQSARLRHHPEIEAMLLKAGAK